MKTVAELCRFLNSRHYFVDADLIGVPYCGHVNWYRLTLGGYSLVGRTG